MRADAYPDASCTAGRRRQILLGLLGMLRHVAIVRLDNLTFLP